MGFVIFLLGIGIVWAAAWAFSPDLTSGTVWFFAYIWASLYANINIIRSKVDKR